MSWHKVGTDETAIELHTEHILEGLSILHCNDSLLSYSLHGIRNQVSDFLISVDSRTVRDGRICQFHQLLQVWPLENVVRSTPTNSVQLLEMTMGNTAQLGSELFAKDKTNKNLPPAV